MYADISPEARSFLAPEGVDPNLDPRALAVNPPQATPAPVAPTPLVVMPQAAPTQQQAPQQTRQAPPASSAFGDA